MVPVTACAAGGSVAGREMPAHICPLSEQIIVLSYIRDAKED